MDIDGWLRGIGLEQYAQTFRDNAIDADVLCDLTDEHLRELGLPLGARLKLLRAVAALSTGQTPVSPDIAPPAPRTDAERRQVTVMFCDLVGSTAMSARMDPEDLREVISAYQKCVAETVGRYGGFVAKYMGDGVLIYFGYPHAHEDDAERAVRAGLELVAAVGALKAQASLQTRVGIATGLVVVGDLIGSGASQEQAIVGETPNLAARLQSIAQPNRVVIAESTRKLVGNLFELEDLGSQELKGIAGAVRAWVALRPASVESRFEALHASGVTELVGREEELDLLLRRWSKAKTGEGQIVLLSGEPGIGKSRLTAALLEHLAAEPHTRLRYFCSPQRTDSAFFPIISQMERAAGFAQDDTTQAKLDKLDDLMAQSHTPRQDIALFADVLSLENDGRHPALELTPQQRRQKTLEALHAQVETLARKSPVLMIFEDAHWSDPTTLEALGRSVVRFATLPVLLLITFRPEFNPPWIGQPHVTPLTLNPLTRPEIEALIDHVDGNKLLAANIRQDIIERTDGIPLFIEEMTKAVLEAESLGAAAEAIAMVPRPVLAVPASLRDSLMARLDRLGPAKEVAQIGAAIGRECPYALLAAVMRKPEAELQSALDSLVDAGLLFRQGVPPHVSYLFKHALLQDAAYGTLLREPRRMLHARIAGTIESQFAEIAENQPEVLARHCGEAGQIEKSAALWSKVGQRSLARSALIESAEQLTRSLALLAALPGTPAVRREEIKLQVTIVTPLMQTKGYAARETKAAVERARFLIEQAETRGESPEDPLLLFSVLNGLWLADYAAGNGDNVRDIAGQFLALAEKQGSIFPLMLGHRLVGTSLLYAGDLTRARTHLDRAIALYDPIGHRPLATRFGQDVRMSSLLRRSLTLWSLGYPEAALSDSDQSLRDAREIGHAATLFFALHGRWWTHWLCGNYAEATALADELVAFADEKGASFWKAAGILEQGHLCVMTGRASVTTQIMPAAISALRSSGLRLHLPLWSSVLAHAYAQLGRFDDAWRCIAEAIAVMEMTKEQWCDPQVHQLAGEIALMTPDPDNAKVESHFRRAITLAQAQQAKSFELRAATGMARLWRDQGKVQEARELLAPVYGWFTEGFDTRDLKEAKALLDELHA